MGFSSIGPQHDKGSIAPLAKMRYCSNVLSDGHKRKVIFKTVRIKQNHQINCADEHTLEIVCISRTEGGCYTSSRNFIAFRKGQCLMKRTRTG
jgi:hypothetical protein